MGLMKSPKSAWVSASVMLTTAALEQGGACGRFKILLRLLTPQVAEKAQPLAIMRSLEDCDKDNGDFWKHFRCLDDKTGTP